MGGGDGHERGKSLGLGSYVCCFSLALLSEVAMFALFQCFSTFQHSLYIDIGSGPFHQMS
jgi:hypothetical protein